MRPRFRLSLQRVEAIHALSFRKTSRGRFFTFSLAVVLSAGFIWPSSLPAAENIPPAMDTDLSMVPGQGLKVLSKKTTLPLFVYGDESGRLSHFIASGFMGDVNSLSSLTSMYEAGVPSSLGRSGHTSMKIHYSAKGKQGWAGIYWLSPANNWGTTKGAGFDLRRATKLTFWVRGDRGGERISQFKTGGVNGPYPDSDAAFLGPVTLTRDWQQMTIDLKGKDFRYVIGGFMFLIRRGENQKGATFYLDEVVFRGNPEDEIQIPISKDDEVEEPAPQPPLAATTATPQAKPTEPPIKSPFAAQGLKLGKAGTQETEPAAKSRKPTSAK